MSGFAGTIGGTFDAKKGRISVPAPFRADLAQPCGAAEIILRPSHHAPCIEVWPEPAFMAEVRAPRRGLS